MKALVTARDPYRENESWRDVPGTRVRGNRTRQILAPIGCINNLLKPSAEPLVHRTPINYAARGPPTMKLLVHQNQQPHPTKTRLGASSGHVSYQVTSARLGSGVAASSP